MHGAFPFWRCLGVYQCINTSAYIEPSFVCHLFQAGWLKAGLYSVPTHAYTCHDSTEPQPRNWQIKDTWWKEGWGLNFTVIHKCIMTKNLLSRFHLFYQYIKLIIVSSWKWNKKRSRWSHKRDILTKHTALFQHVVRTAKGTPLIPNDLFLTDFEQIYV